MKNVMPGLIIGWLIGLCIVQCNSPKPIGFTKVKCGAGIICQVGPDSTLIIMLDPGFHPDTSLHFYIDTGTSIVYPKYFHEDLHTHCPKEKWVQKMIIHDYLFDSS